jgi:hypothetical protein
MHLHVPPALLLILDCSIPQENCDFSFPFSIIALKQLASDFSLNIFMQFFRVTILNLSLTLHLPCTDSKSMNHGIDVLPQS